MRAAEVLNRYAQGERNFQGVDLRNQNFRNQDLSNANFCGADLRGTNFSHSTLINTDFSNARCGLPQYWLGLLPLIFLFICLFSGVTASVFETQDDQLYTSWLIILSTLSIVFIFISILLSHQTNYWSSPLLYLLLLLLSTSFFVWLGLGSLVAVLFGAVIAALPLHAFQVEFGKNKLLIVIFILCGIDIAIIWWRSGLNVINPKDWIIFASANFICGTLLNYTATKNRDFDSWVRSLSCMVFIPAGTSFNSADLTKATFASTRLIHTSLLNVEKIGTCFKGVQQLDYASP